MCVLRKNEGPTHSYVHKKGNEGEKGSEGVGDGACTGRGEAAQLFYEAPESMEASDAPPPLHSTRTIILRVK